MARIEPKFDENCFLHTHGNAKTSSVVLSEFEPPGLKYRVRVESLFFNKVGNFSSRDMKSYKMLALSYISPVDPVA